MSLTDQILRLLHWGMYEVPPGPKFVTVSTVVNIQKVGMPIYLLGLVLYFQNFSQPMLTYSVMHGSYGILWYLKHIVFPDPSLQEKCTFSCALICWVLILGPYMLPAYLLAAEIAPNNTQGPLRLYGATFMYIISVSVALLSDAQKNYTLALVKHRPLLISNGFFKYTRSPNHLAEMFIYLSFMLIVDHLIGYVIIAWAFSSIFLARVFQKEMSLRKKKGWDVYAAHSWPFFPKINGSTS